MSVLHFIGFVLLLGIFNSSFDSSILSCFHHPMKLQKEEPFADWCFIKTQGKAKKVVQAQELWFAIVTSQIETETPYMLFKDTCNRKSNQQNLGTIKSSNLCTEIIEYTSPTETAVCNLASIALPRYVREKGVPAESQPAKLVGSQGSGNRYFDFDKLAEITSLVTKNLNKIIDVNYYPVDTAKRSNLRHRPIGIGVQGLADAFILLGMPFEF